jgi:tetratricopeptide (TPR) repeat protein
MRANPADFMQSAEVIMRVKKLRLIMRTMKLGIALAFCSSASAQHIGKYVPIPAGSDADHATQAIAAETDPAKKLALIDKFAAELGTGDMAIVADEMYVNYYVAQKNYPKAFEYGDKLFALDPDNLQNAVNMVQAASQAGDSDKLLAYAEKTSGILQRYKAAPAPSGVSEDQWKQDKASALQSSADNIRYIEQSAYAAIYQSKDVPKKAAAFAKFAELFPDSPFATQALGMAANSYQQAQNAPKMLEVANGLLAKDPNNMGMLLLLSDYYAEKGEQLDKAEAYAKKAANLADGQAKPEGVSDDDWKKQTTLQKGLALSTLGQVSLQKKDNAGAVTNLVAAAPLLKSNDTSYARNQYRLGFAYLNLKKLPEAKQAFTDAASVNTPYKQPALDKLKGLPATAPGARKRPA